MTQQAREEGRTTGAGDLAGDPEEKEGARAGTERLCEVPGIQEVLEPFFQRIFWYQNKM